MLIVGAGPAGAITALALENSGLSVAILDKAPFPRDKTCGDALSVDVMNQLDLISPALLSSLNNFQSKTLSYGVKIFGPDRSYVNIPFIYKKQKRSGFICRRFDFDNLLVQHLKELRHIKLFENCHVEEVKRLDEKIFLNTSQGSFVGKIVIGADGAHSIVSKKLNGTKIDKEHYSAGLRIYYEGISSFHPDQLIELYFFRDVLPGYLWIFPLPDNKANVGIGMLSSVVAKKNINLKAVLQKQLSTHPDLKERFLHAKPLETVKGYGLPLGSKKRVLSGERFLLTGDAASLIDPFTGEGIANAIRSGRIAAEHIKKCFEANDFSKQFNSEYDKEIYCRMWNELKLSTKLQRLCRYPWLFNFVIRKANQSKYVHQLLVDALAHVEQKKSLVSPAFYYKLLFNKHE